MDQRFAYATVVAALVATACGPAATSESSSTVATVASSIANTSVVSNATTSLATTSAPTSTPTTIATTTTAPPLVCSRIDHLTGLGVAKITYIDDGHLWGVEIDTIACLADIPDHLSSLGYTWGPGGDKVLFADGSILGPEIQRGPIGDIANSMGWTRPTGTSTIHVSSDGTLTKTTSEFVFEETRLTPLVSHDAVAYHPDGTTFAVSGSDGTDQGVWISKNDGSEAQLFAAADIGVTIPEMVFTNDARWLIFIADHTQDDFDDGYHLHSAFTEPFELEDGSMALGSAAEFGANSHLVSDVPLDSIVVPYSGSGLADLPDGIALAQGACGPDRRAVYLPDGNVGSDPIPLSTRPSYPVGFSISDGLEQAVVVAMSDDGCTGPFDWQVVVIDRSDLTTRVSASGAGVDSLAVQATLPRVDITLSGVIIEPFA